jgi:hypothetical protein
MQNKVYSYYKDLPPWAKGVVVVGGGLVFALVGFKIYKAVFPSGIDRKNRELLNTADKEIRDNLNKGIKPSFSDLNYIAFANTIYDGMRYCVGDDYGTVEATLKKMQNDIDVAKLIKAFGTRQDYCFGIPESSPRDLFTFVQSELGNDYLYTTNYRVKRINADWKKKGITYQI